MIQRIQSIWLLLAALCNAGLFMFDLYRVDEAAATAGARNINVVSHYPSLLIAIVITLLPFIAIFMFKNRKKQRLMALMGMVLTIGFLALTLMRVTNVNNATSAPTTGSYWIGSILPVLAIVFLIMAIRGIRNDERLVKSMDRLR
jgi:FtsH-binding integral membrane protein